MTQVSEEAKQTYYGLLCEVRDSEIEGAGRGLFAKVRINKGQRICFYGGDERETREEIQELVEAEPHRRRYTFTHGDRHMVGDPHNIVEGASGFMANDAYFIEPDYVLALYDQEDLPAGIMEYYACAIRKANAQLGHELVATRTIEAGEEITVVYGFRYWFASIWRARREGTRVGGVQV